MVNDRATIPLPCPGCGAKTEKAVGWFEDTPGAFDCSGCGETVHLESQDVRQLVATFGQVEKSLGDLRRLFGSFG